LSDPSFTDFAACRLRFLGFVVPLFLLVVSCVWIAYHHSRGLPANSFVKIATYLAIRVLYLSGFAVVPVSAILASPVACASVSDSRLFGDDPLSCAGASVVLMGVFGVLALLLWGALVMTNAMLRFESDPNSDRMNATVSGRTGARQVFARLLVGVLPVAAPSWTLVVSAICTLVPFYLAARIVVVRGGSELLGGFAGVTRPCCAFAF